MSERKYIDRIDRAIRKATEDTFEDLNAVTKAGLVCFEQAVSERLIQRDGGTLATFLDGFTETYDQLLAQMAGDAIARNKDIRGEVYVGRVVLKNADIGNELLGVVTGLILDRMRANQKAAERASNHMHVGIDG